LLLGPGRHSGHGKSLVVPSLCKCKGALDDGQLVPAFPPLDLFLGALAQLDGLLTRRIVRIIVIVLVKLGTRGRLFRGTLAHPRISTFRLPVIFRISFVARRRCCPGRQFQ